MSVLCPSDLPVMIVYITCGVVAFIILTGIITMLLCMKVKMLIFIVLWKIICKIKCIWFSFLFYLTVDQTHRLSVKVCCHHTQT